MEYVIPLRAEPNQSFSIELDGHIVDFEFLTRGVFLYMNLTVDSVNKVNGIICLNNSNLLLYPNFGVNGKLYFKDTQGNLDPIYYGLNDRWLLIYEV